MSLTKSPYEIVNPKDRWIPTIEKDLSKFLPPLVLKIRKKFLNGERTITMVRQIQRNHY